jgi:hypothetical protein
MAAPDYVPPPTDTKPRVYTSPPWRGDVWLADRPAELGGAQPLGPRLGTPGPDQGYALKLARRFEGRLVLAPGEAEEDAVAGCLAVAMRRSSQFGRAPVIHDLTVAFTLWGFLDEAPPELVAVRTRLFAAVASPHHYMERRAIVDAVPDELLSLTPAQAAGVVRDEPSRVVAMAEAALAGAAYVADPTAG